MYIIIEGLSATASCFLRYISSNLEYLLQNMIYQVTQTLLFNVGAEIVNLLFLYSKH